MATHVSYEHRNPKKLKRHPVNKEIRREAMSPEFLASCKRGIHNPLLITEDDRIISGHRRQQAAIEHNLEEVPVIVRRDLQDALDIEEVLLDCMEQDELSTEEKARAFQRRLAIEEKRAKQRQKAAGGAKQSDDERLAQIALSAPEQADAAIEEGNGEHLAQSAPSDSGKAVRIAAEASGLSEHTAEKAAEVIKHIDHLESRGKTEEAQELRETLNRNVSAAYREIASEDQEDKPVLDQAGGPVSKRFRAVFEAVTTFRGLLSRLGRIHSDVAELQQTKAGGYIPFQEFERELRKAQDALRFATPYCVCPKCRGKGGECKTCKGAGWITEPIYTRSHTEADDEWLKSRK